MLNIPHDLELEESERILMHKAFSAASHACCGPCSRCSPVKLMKWILTAQLCLKSDWSTAQSLFYPSRVLYMSNYYLNCLFTNWSWNPADNAATQFVARICYIIRNLTVTKSTEDVCLSIPGHPTLNSDSKYFFCEVSSNCWIKCHNSNMGHWSFLVSGEKYWVSSPKISYVVFS